MGSFDKVIAHLKGVGAKVYWVLFISFFHYSVKLTNSDSTVETPEKGVNGVAQVPLLLTSNVFHTFL